MKKKNVVITGYQKLQKDFERMLKEEPRKLAAAMYDEAEDIMTAAKDLTPVDTNTLRSSGHVAPPVISPGRISITLGFGGAASDYAEYVHENMDAYHPVGQAKFLEVPFRNSAKGMGARIAARMNRK